MVNFMRLMRCTLRISANSNSFNQERARKMKVLLVKDVYKLGRAGDIKRVADGYGRNYLLPQRLAVLATPGALKQIEYIRKAAVKQRAEVNQEMSGLADMLSNTVLTFTAKAGETGKLYGSITHQMIVDQIKEKHGVEIDRRNIESEPLRNLGEHEVKVRLTFDLTPVIKAYVIREGESLPEIPQKSEAAVEEVSEEETAE